MKLGRVIAEGKFVPEIDGLRFIAISSVVAFHIYQSLIVKEGMIPFLVILDIFLQNGQRGVPLFFVISGFILGRRFAIPCLTLSVQPKLQDYFLRRLTRMEPPYLVALLGVFVGLAFFTGRHETGHLLASIFYIHNFVYGYPNPFFGLAWSLEIEAQFYCLLPFLATIYRLPRFPRRAILLACTLLGILHFLPLGARFNLSVLGFSQYFAAGMLFADFYSDGWRPSQHWVFDLLSIVLWPSIFIIPDHVAWIVLPTFCIILYVSAFKSFLFKGLLTLRFFTIVGGMCYTIYLVHFPMISL